MHEPARPLADIPNTEGFKVELIRAEKWTKAGFTHNTAATVVKDGEGRHFLESERGYRIQLEYFSGWRPR